jgi:FAD/FMN-containing dehydrogenase
MITRHGPQTWENVHVTETTRLAGLFSIDNSRPLPPRNPGAFDDLRQAAAELDGLVQDARRQGKRMRALGSGWALTDIAVTDGWLVNTKALNGCFDVAESYFDGGYDPGKRAYLVVAQCGISMGELNIHLEIGAHSSVRRSLRTAGIGAGQTVVGAFSGNTHGAAVKFGSTPDFVVGIQLVTGTGRSRWLERASYPVMNEQFVEKIGADLLRDDDLFNAALVSFGSFGIISAVAIETEPIYHLNFQPVQEVTHASINQTMLELSRLGKDDPAGPHHYEFIFDPYSKERVALQALADKVEFDVDRPSLELPVWIVRNQEGYSAGDQALRTLLDVAPVPPSWVTAFQYRTYRKRAILDNIRATPGQLFTATISYFEGFTESAIAISIDDVPIMLEIGSAAVRSIGVAAISQVRVVHPTEALLGFTRHAPKTVIFEFGLSSDRKSFARFERTLTAALRAAGVAYTFHWSKNSGLDGAALRHMYGQERIDRWRAARERVFGHDASLRSVFDNRHLERAGLT